MWNTLLVALGAGLWATDTLFRHPLVQQVSPLTLVYFEHIFASIVSLIVLLATSRKQIFFAWKEFFGAAFVGVFGSAVATVLFTMSFQFVNPSVSILIQKIQPVFVIILSSAFLGEKPGRGFLFWAAIAMASTFVLSFPDGVHAQDLQSGASIGSFLAFVAALLWAFSTVVGKFSLKKAAPAALTFWRFAFGLGALYLLTRRFDQARIEIPFVMTEPAVIRSLLFMAVVPGFLGVTLYYRGLSKVSASVATILELSFPLVAVVVNAYFLNLYLTPTQVAATVVLLLAMVGVSQTSR